MRKNFWNEVIGKIRRNTTSKRGAAFKFFRNSAGQLCLKNGNMGAANHKIVPAELVEKIETLLK